MFRSSKKIGVMYNIVNYNFNMFSKVTFKYPIYCNNDHLIKYLY